MGLAARTPVAWVESHFVKDSAVIYQDELKLIRRFRVRFDEAQSEN